MHLKFISLLIWVCRHAICTFGVICIQDEDARACSFIGMQLYWNNTERSSLSVKQTLRRSLGIQEDSVSASLMTDVSVCSVGMTERREKSRNMTAFYEGVMKTVK